jgi:hypothetical protein
MNDSGVPDRELLQVTFHGLRQRYCKSLQEKVGVLLLVLLRLVWLRVRNGLKDVLNYLRKFGASLEKLTGC